MNSKILFINIHDRKTLQTDQTVYKNPSSILFYTTNPNPYPSRPHFVLTLTTIHYPSLLLSLCYSYLILSYLTPILTLNSILYAFYLRFISFYFILILFYFILILTLEAIGSRFYLVDPKRKAFFFLYI